MKTSVETQYEVNHWSIDICSNDPVDIRCGGPQTLGFDFYLDADLAEKDVKKFLTNECKKYYTSYSIYKGGKKKVAKYHTFEQAAKIIKDYVSSIPREYRK